MDRACQDLNPLDVTPRTLEPISRIFHQNLWFLIVWSLYWDTILAFSLQEDPLGHPNLIPPMGLFFIYVKIQKLLYLVDCQNITLRERGSSQVWQAIHIKKVWELRDTGGGVKKANFWKTPYRIKIVLLLCRRNSPTDLMEGQGGKQEIFAFSDSRKREKHV